MFKATYKDLKAIIKEAENNLKRKNLNYYVSWENYKMEHCSLDFLLNARLKLKGEENYSKYLARNYILFEQSIDEDDADILFNQLICVISDNEHELKLYKK